MRRFLASSLLVATVAASVDTLSVRARFGHRDLGAELYLQSWILWFAFVLLAWVPLSAWLWLRRRRAQTTDAPLCAVLLAGLSVGPILLHWRLDAFSDLGGGLAGLKTMRPWLEVVGVLALLVAVLLGFRQLAMHMSVRSLAFRLALVSLGVGLFLNLPREGPDDPSPAGSGKPNLLLLVWDTTRAQSLSIYGYGRKTTPHLEALAEQSIVFDNARSPSRYTLTSHLSMLTGVYPSDHGARMTRQRISPNKTPSVAATLRAAGYRTGAFVGTGVLTAPTGMDFGFEHYDDLVDPPLCDTRAWGLVHDLQSLAARLGPPWSQNGQPHWFQDFFRPAGEVLANAKRWIDEPDPRPWFCMVNLYDVHWPYLPDEQERQRWVDKYDGPVDGYHAHSDTFPRDYRMQPRDDSHLLELYDAEMSELDANVERFLAGLDLEHGNTAVLLSADHGEAFGEGGKYEHNDVLEPQVHIPFLVRLPGPQSGPKPRVRAPVSGIDVAPTLLGIAGLPTPQHYVGIDVLTLKDGDDPEAAAPRAILVEDRDQMRVDHVTLVLYLGNWKLTRRGLGEKKQFQLFDLSSDPIGLVDVAGEHPKVVANMKTELEALRARWHADDAVDQRGTGYSNADALRGLGY